MEGKLQRMNASWKSLQLSTVTRKRIFLNIPPV